MSDHHDAQDYTANGPTAVGFQTGGDGTGIANGVVAGGTESGVHGIGLGDPGSSAMTYGVLGESKTGYGVKGYSENLAGVLGISHNEPGVKGSGNAVGVEGDGKTGVFGHGDTGVKGDGKVGAGVNGHSESGAGVHGSSDRDRGGIFESQGLVGQVRLIPCEQVSQVPQLPKSGKVGDFFLIRHKGTVEGRERFDFCSLWLCVPENFSRDDSAQWQEIMLGNVRSA